MTRKNNKREGEGKCENKKKKVLKRATNETSALLLRSIGLQGGSQKKNEHEKKRHEKKKGHPNLFLFFFRDFSPSLTPKKKRGRGEREKIRILPLFSLFLSLFFV